MKKHEIFKFSGAWHNDVELHERFQVQEMLNRLAEESVRRMEMVCIIWHFVLSLTIRLKVQDFFLLIIGKKRNPESTFKVDSEVRSEYFIYPGIVE